MKKQISLLLALVMLLSCIPFGAFAADAAYYVAGTSSLCGSNWSNNDPANQMTLNENGLYEKTFEDVPVGTHEFKVTDGTWDNCWPSSNYVLTTDEVCDVTITFNAETKAVQVSLGGQVVAVPYYVAGVAELCGNAWACDDAANKMTLDTDGLYKKTYENVPAGTYEFKVTDGTWDNCWPSQNYVLTTTEEQNVTITFNADTTEVNVVLSDVVVEVPYYVAGSAALCGSEWNNCDPANKMSLNEDGLYEKTYESVSAGTYEFKVTDGTWDNCWPEQNYSLTVETLSNVTILFNEETKEVSVKMTEVTTEPEEPEVPTEPEEPVITEPYIVAGTDALCGSSWTPGDVYNRMTLNADGLYEKVYTNVPAGTHEFKVTDGTWDNSWGDNGNNYVFETTEVQNVIILFNEETKEIQVITADAGDYYTVAGTEALCGTAWTPAYESNMMVHWGENIYKKTFKSVPAGTHEFKVTDGSWNNSWGDNGNNFAFTTEKVQNVTITFNAETKEITVTMSAATAPDPVPPTEPVEYDIEIKVHYYRADGDYTDWEVHMWNGVESLSSTRKFEDDEVTYEGVTYPKTATYYADASDTWVGFIVKKPDWTKDPDGDRHIDISDVTGGTVHVYAKSGSALEDFDTDKSEATLGAKVTAAVYNQDTGILTVTVSYPPEDVNNETFTLEGPDGEMTITGVEALDEYNYTIDFEGIIDEESVYTIYFEGVPCVVTVPNLYSTKNWEAENTYTGDDLGATWTAEATTFRLWAPTATAVSVNLYESGTEGTDDLIASHEMTEDVNGTWIVTVEGDLNGV